MSSVQVRVALGVKWLDRNKPGWEHKVRLNRLDMSEGCSCVLGQVFAKDANDRADGFYHVMDYMLPAKVEPEKWSVRHGFDYQDSKVHYNAPQDYDALAAEWTRIIKQRREAL